MVWVRERYRQGVEEYCGRIFEIYAMLFQIRHRFPRMPLKSHDV